MLTHCCKGMVISGPPIYLLQVGLGSSQILSEKQWTEGYEFVQSELLEGDSWRWDVQEILFPKVSFAHQWCYWDDFRWYKGKLCLNDYIFVNYPKLTNMAKKINACPFKVMPNPISQAHPMIFSFSRTRVSKLRPGNQIQSVADFCTALELRMLGFPPFLKD